MSGTVRIVEARAFMEFEDLANLGMALAELRGIGVPGDAEVGLVSSTGGVYLWARYAYDGDQDDVELEPNDLPQAVTP